MTVVILDRPRGPLPPYLTWLGDGGRDVVLLTGRGAADLGAYDTGGYSDLRCFGDFATSAEVERAVLRLAGRTRVSAVVATDDADLIRSGALRDHLGLSGTGREDAIALRDLVAQRRRLSGAGIPAVPCHPVRRIMDLYWYADRHGYPIRVRERREAGWPVLATPGDEAAIAAFTGRGLAPELETAPSLVVEPAAGERAPAPDELRDRVRAALPPPVGSEQVVDAVRAPGGRWLVDAVRCDLASERSVRAQAGLGGRPVR
jgi:hypothetical protein